MTSPLQAKVERLSAELMRLDNKCDDLEARSRRNNIRLVGIPEDFSTSSTAMAVSSLLKEAFKLEKEPLVDRVHRTLQPKPNPNSRPSTLSYGLCGHPAASQGPATDQDRGHDFFCVPRPHSQDRSRPSSFSLLYPALLRVTHNGMEKEFKSPEEASAFMGHSTHMRTEKRYATLMS